MKRICFVLPFLLTTSFLTSCGNNSKGEVAMELVVSVNRNETISFEHNNKDKITVDWGNGKINSNCSCSYVEAKEYTITITGALRSFKYTTDRDESLISMTIGNVISLADEAFYGCCNLEAVKWLGNVRLKEISELAFHACSKLTSISIPDSVTSIDDMAFMNCTDLASVIISDNVTSIGDDAFGECPNLSVYTEENINYLGSNTNKYFLALSTNNDEGTYVINDQCKILHSGIFNNKKLTEINIPDSVISLSDYAFQECTQLETVSINSSSSLKGIGYGTFSGCTALNSITIPDSIISIGEGAFDECPNLNVYTEGDINYLGNSNNNFVLALSIANEVDAYTINSQCKILYPLMFKEKGFLKSINIPDSVVFMGEEAFQECTQLETVSINPSSSLKEIGVNAFNGCEKLTSITIPGNVILIGYLAFCGCDILSTVDLTNLHHVPETGGEIFSTSLKLEHIYVRSDMLKAFKRADGWNEYADIITDDPIPKIAL